MLSVRRGVSLLPYIGNLRIAKKAAWIVAPLLCFALGACSVSMPMGSLIGAHDDDETGSIEQQQPQMDGLKGEDWQRAKSALDSALASQSKDAVSWDNPASGTKGSFTPIGDAYDTDTGKCRGFRAAVDRKDADDALQGTACTDKSGGNWVITDVKPWNNS